MQYNKNDRWKTNVDWGMHILSKMY